MRKFNNFSESLLITASGFMKILLSLKKLLFIGVILGFTGLNTMAQPPSHDPTSMIRNTDGRYWIFTTGEGIWCMSSSNRDFSNWRGEPTPFAPGTWPSWVNSYVQGFEGSFWAPGIIRMNGYYYLYYSVSTFGSSRSAIGVTRASNLAGPWTDLGVVVSSNGSRSAINAIDPALFRDTDGRVYMSYGSWFGGIAVVEINQSTGKTTGGTTHIAGGNHQDREAPFIYKHGDYYFLFSNRGSCCNGTSSSYYVVVSRSTNVRGPYTDERVFLSNRNGNIVGPGHIGYGEDRLTYHYYDANDNGAAKLRITTMGIRNGWPVAGVTGDDGSTTGGGDGASINGTYAIIASHSGKALDVYNWGTSNGTNIAQWSYWGGEPQQFNIRPVDGEWHTIEAVLAPGKVLDINNISTSNGANVQLWDNWTGAGQQFRFQSAGSGKWRIINRNSGKCIDVEGVSTADGANVFQWECISGAGNQMFSLNRLKAAENHSEEMLTNERRDINLYPNPVVDNELYLEMAAHLEGNAEIFVYNSLGELVYNESYKASAITGNIISLDVSGFSEGLYVVSIQQGNRVFSEKIVKKIS